eukprot:6421810-Amphidinium_carterae.1
MDVYGDHALVCQCSSDRNARIITYETFWRKQQIKADCSRKGRSRVCYLTMLEYRLRQHSFVDRPTSMCLADITIKLWHKRTAYDMAVTPGLSQRAVQQ